MIIHKDFSGELKATVRLPDALNDQFAGIQTKFSEENIQKLFQDLNGITLTQYEFTPGRRAEAKFSMKFKSLERLNEAIQSRPPVSFLLGTVTVKREDDRAVIERQLGGGDVQANQILSSNTAMYLMKFSSPIKATNSGFYNNHGQEVRFRYSLAEIQAQKPILSTTVQIPIPWLWIGLGAIAVFAALWLAWKYLFFSNETTR